MSELHIDWTAEDGAVEELLLSDVGYLLDTVREFASEHKLVALSVHYDCDGVEFE